MPDTPNVEEHPIQRCGAKARSTGHPCKSFAVRGGKRCRMHGGTSLKGIASGTYKTGEFSKVMPPSLAERFAKMSRDPELLSLGRLVAVLQSRMVEVLGEIGKRGAIWEDVFKWQDAMELAQRKGDVPAQRVALNEMISALKAGRAELQRWEEVGDLIEKVRRLIDSIKKHQVQSQQIVTLMQMQMLFSGLAKLVRKAFVGLMAQLRDDREKEAVQRALREVSDGFVRLAHLSNTPMLSANLQ